MYMKKTYIFTHTTMFLIRELINTVPEVGSSGSYGVYTGLRRTIPAFGTVLRIILYVR